jgi:hypothetical protein
MTENVVDYPAFMAELTADVEDVTALQAKVQAILDATEGPDFIEAGTMCTCDCGRDLREHLQDILDDDDFALQLINPLAQLLDMLDGVFGPEDEDGFPGFFMMS